MRRVLASALAALTVLAAAGSHPGTAARSRGYWIVVSSDRDGALRGYSVRPDGSRLTPLVARSRAVAPEDVSADGSTIAYEGLRDDDWIYVSRADGTRLHRVVRKGFDPTLSRDGSRLAFIPQESAVSSSRIAVVGTDGHGLRRLTSGEDEEPSWAPDGRSLVFRRTVERPNGDSTDSIVVQPLRAKPHVLARGSRLRSPEWSPAGRWIAYQATGGLYAVQPNGAHRHRIVSGTFDAFSWSPDGSRVAVAAGNRVLIAGAGGRVLKRMRLRVGGIGAVAWSPDGRRLALGSASVWVVGVDGAGLRPVASEGSNGLLGWTPLAPVRRPAPPVPPSERLVGAAAVATRMPVTDLSADGARVAFAVSSSTVDCAHVVVWTPAKRTLARFGKASPCEPYNGAGGLSSLELAGSRAAWVQITDCGNYCHARMQTATLAKRTPLSLADEDSSGSDPEEPNDPHLRGDGDLLVFDDGSRLVRIGHGHELCEHGNYPARICTTVRRGPHSEPVDSVSAGLIAVREPAEVAIVDAQGSVVRSLPFGAKEVSAAYLDGDRLAVARSKLLEVYDVRTGAGLLQRPLPNGYTLHDVDGGIAVLRHGAAVMLLRLADGRSFTLRPGRTPVAAELEPPGLFYSSTTAARAGRVVFMPRAEVLRRLGG